MNSLKLKLIPMLLLLVTGLSFGQAEKTLVKSFNLEGKQVVVLDLKGDVEVQQWKNSTMRVQVTVALPEGNTTMLKSLITAGRYNIKSEAAAQDYNVFVPGLKKEVTIKGKPLKEQISFVVFAPEDTIVKMAGDASTSIDTGTDSSL